MRSHVARTTLLRGHARRGLQKRRVEGCGTSALALGIHPDHSVTNLMVGRSLDILDEPNPHETVDKKGENQGGCKEGLGERGGGGQEVQTVFAAVKVNAE